MEQGHIKIYARFDLAQEGHRLDWKIVDSSGESLYEKDGANAGSVLLPPHCPVRLEIIGHRSTMVERMDAELAFWLEGIALITVPRGDTRFSSPFKTKYGAVQVFRPDQFKSIAVSKLGAHECGYELSSDAGLKVGKFNGSWELSLLATVRRSDSKHAQHTVLRFDPEVKIGAGNNPPK